jgi:four helix bundle protein
MHNFKELKIWQMARELVSHIYKIISIPSNISEGAGRNSEKDFLRFIDIASGSAFEIETQLYLCCDLKYFTEQELVSYIDKVQKIQKMLYNFRLTLSH